MKNVYKDMCDEFFAKYLETAWREKLDGEKVTNNRIFSDADDRPMPKGLESAGKRAGASLGDYLPRGRKAQPRKSKNGKKLGRPRTKKK